jgi:hypothetical protein
MKIQKVDAITDDVRFADLRLTGLFTWGARQNVWMKVGSNKGLDLEAEQLADFDLDKLVVRCDGRLLVSGLK